MKYKKIKPRRTKFKDRKIIYIFLLFLFMGVGYAALTTSLSINGTTNVATNSWNIHFANLYVQSGSVEPAAPTVSTNSISYSATLAQPGDFYEFSVDVKNDGTLPGKVSLVNLTGNSTNYLSTSFTYSNGDPISVGDIINAGKSKRLTIKAWISEDIDTSLLPTVDTPTTLTFNLQYIQSEEDSPSDATDQIIALAKNNTCMTKYTGQVTDKVGITEQATQVYFDECSDKRNVIFNNMCWQVIRTTETGGIKLLYNGEPEEGKCLNTRGNHTGIIGEAKSNEELNDSYLYGNSFTYNKSTGVFILEDTITSTWSDSTYTSLIGKFTCKNLTGSCSTLYSVGGYKSNTEAIVGMYTISSTVYSQIGKSPFNAYNKSLGMVGYMFNKEYKLQEKYVGTTDNKYGNSFIYDTSTGLYSLSGIIQIIDDWYNDYSQINNTHYTCWNNTGTCNTISYIHYADNNWAYYINLSEGNNTNDALEEVLYSDEVNHYNSTIKGIIDTWYKQELINNMDKMENTVFCNSRNIVDYGGLDPNGGKLYSLRFKNYDNTDDLSCMKLTDQFSVDNTKAKLTYPVALLEAEEVSNIQSEGLIQTGSTWWVISPMSINSYNVSNKEMFNVLVGSGVGSNDGVRPVISLASGNTFASGSGSESDPWIIQE